MIKPKVVFSLSVILFFLCSVIGVRQASFAQTSASQIEKAQQDLEMEKALRTEVEKGQKVLINKIIVKGVTQLTEERIKEIILPFQKHWLTKDDIQRIIDSLQQSYQQKSQTIPTISYQVKGRKLIIDVQEKKR